MPPSISIVIIAGLVWALSASTSFAVDPPSGVYALKADTGRYLARCRGCVPGGAYPDSASLHVTNSNGPWAKWTLSKRPNGKWVLQVDTKRYLTRCRNCGPGAYPDSAFVHGTDPNAPYAQWTLSQRPNGKYVLQSDTGRYLTRCRNCFRGSPYPDMVFVHVTDPNGPWAQWDLVPLRVNVARGKTARQSAEAYGGKAQRAVDGNTNGNWSAASVTHTNNQNPWWEVDLGGIYDISSIRIWNRTDCCRQRLTGFQILVGDSPITANDNRVFGGGLHSFGGENFKDIKSTANTRGRYVRISLPRAEYLSLAEVEVFGKLAASQAPAVVPPTAPSTTTPKPQRGAQEVAAIAQQERAIQALASARRERWPAPRIQSVGDFIVAVGGDHINGLARLGDYWITNYPGDQNGNRSKGRLFSLLQSGAYKATFFDTEGGYPAGMTVLDRDNILAVDYDGASTETVRFFDYSRGLNSIRELTPWVDSSHKGKKRVAAAYNTDERVYYFLVAQTLWRGRYGKWEQVGWVEWHYNAGPESIGLLYLGYKTFAAIAPGSGEDKDKFKYTIFKVNAKNDFTYISQGVELTMKNPGYTGDGFGASFRWGTSIHTNFSRNMFRMCAAPRRQVAFGDFYCWTSPVVSRTYPITIKTSHTEGAGTDSEIYLSLTGEKGATLEARLNDLISGNAFENGQTDTVRLVTADVGRPTRVTLRSDGAEAGAAWLPQSIQITYGGAKLIANNSAWFKKGNKKSLSLVPQKTYTVKVKTGNRTGAGTDANISLRIGTVTTKLNPLGRGNLFEKGDLNTFSITQPQANLTSIRVTSDGKYAGANWYLEYVQINGLKYSCNCWFNRAMTRTLYKKR